MEHQKFLCADNKSCIPLRKVCDDQKDCEDGSDEAGKCQELKSGSACSTFGCPAKSECVVLPSGPACACPKGFKFNATSKLCADVNECLIFGICSQGCSNSEGSYTCHCAPQFKMLDDNRTCEAAGDADALLIYAGYRAVNAVTLKSKHMYPIADNLNQVIGTSYDGRYVYWTDISLHTESITRCKVDGSQSEVR